MLKGRPFMMKCALGVLSERFMPAHSERTFHHVRGQNHPTDTQADRSSNRRRHTHSGSESRAEVPAESP